MNKILELTDTEVEYGHKMTYRRTWYVWESGDHVTERLTRDGQIINSYAYPLNSEYAQSRMAEYAASELVTFNQM